MSAGGANHLGDAVMDALDLAGFNTPDAVAWLQAWCARHSTGAWGHRHGVQIETAGSGAG